MAEPFKALKVMEGVYWVGAIDWAGRDFHGYRTERGTTYNAFLILGEKVTLVDAVKAPFKEELLARIASVIDPERIDYIISTKGLDYLPENLQEIARLRKTHFDLSLKELGEIMDKPLGQSGVNHRLRKIVAIAQDLKEQLDKK